MKRSLYVSLIMILLCGSTFLYGNCSSPQHENATQGSALALSGECGDMKSIFAQTYHPFLKSTCNACHVPGGRGKGTFADSNFETSWSAFQFAGYSKISEFAVNPGHNAPYTGPQNAPQINRFKEAWIAGLEDKERCQPGNGGGDETIGPRYNTVAKTIGLSGPGQSKVIEWTLSRDLVADAGLTLPVLPGAVVSVKIEIVEVLGQISYYVSEPRLKNSSTDIYLKSIRTKINGHYIPGETTFTFVERNIYKNTDTLLSAGTMVALGTNNASDTVALSFETLEAITLPPPDLGPSVSFAMATQTTAETGFVDIQVSLSKEPTKAVIAQVEIAAPSTTKVRRSARSEAQPYDFFDWDVTFGTVAAPANMVTLTFVPGNPLVQTVRLLISDDQRDEPDERAVISLNNIENGVRGTNPVLTITVTDNDAAPTNPFVKTFSQLMTQNGILNRRCLECHNTVLKEGGYDMTDYSSMISTAKRVLVPGQPLESEMYKRLRLSGPGRMPLDQALDPVDQRDIENWITGGAQNN